jgi:flagellar assembly protein FliH
MSAVEFDFESLAAPGPFVAGAVAAPPDADAVLAAVARAEAQAEAVREAARAEGLAAGLAEARAVAAPAAAALAEALEGVRIERAELADRLERQAVELALDLAEKVLAGALAVEPERVVEAVRGALRGLVERERVTVLVHPDDLDTVRAAMGDLRDSLGGVEHCEVQAERRVARGGAIVRTPDGDVDARVETKLERAREAVRAALGSAG